MQFIETWISMWYDFTGKANYKMERKKETDMYNIRKVTDDITWIGASDRRLALFENIFQSNAVCLTTPMFCWMSRPSF